MVTNSKKPELTEIIEAIMTRYDRYARYLNYPGEWGERAFRGWIVFELFHAYLGWPLDNIVFGERYDVLFVDEDVKPRVYLETKKPGKGLANLDEFKRRIPTYQTLKYAVLANGYEWLREDITMETQHIVKLGDSGLKWEKFVKPLRAKKYLYGVRE